MSGSVVFTLGKRGRSTIKSHLVFSTEYYANTNLSMETHSIIYVRPWSKRSITSSQINKAISMFKITPNPEQISKKDLLSSSTSWRHMLKNHSKSSSRKNFLLSYSHFPTFLKSTWNCLSMSSNTQQRKSNSCISSNMTQ